MDGANARQLTQDKSLGYGPKFSPDGSKIAYSSDKSGYRDTYVIDLGSKKRTCVAQFPGQNTGATFSPDGSTLALSLSKFGNPEICTTVAPTALLLGPRMAPGSFTYPMSEAVPAFTSSPPPGVSRNG
ncbi:MAG: hypothetical protein EBZ44_04775 [Verrucomicrobia bacterium]|nr:hypothetical protein [Verrucomicrobiota bacterium]